MSINNENGLEFLEGYKEEVKNYLHNKLKKGERHLIVFSPKVRGKSHLKRLLNENGFETIEEFQFEQRIQRYEEDFLCNYRLINFNELDVTGTSLYKLWK